MNEWEKYDFNATDPRARAPIDNVYHVAHLLDAQRIIEDRRIRSSLVFDDSKLNNSRTCVSWVSANTWYDGSLYGTTQFEFDWPAITKGKSIFWVEAKESYSPAAFRFLLTNHPGKSLPVKKYDPESDNGPLKLIDNRWYRNAKLTSEFLIDDDLFLSESTGTTLISHHQDRCRYGIASCPHKINHISDQDAHAKLVAFLLTLNESSRITKRFIERLRVDVNGSLKVNNGILAGFSRLGDDLSRNVPFSARISSNKAIQRQLVLCAIAALACGNRDSARTTIGCLPSMDAFDEIYEGIVSSFSGVKFEMGN